MKGSQFHGRLFNGLCLPVIKLSNGVAEALFAEELQVKNCLLFRKKGYCRLYFQSQFGRLDLKEEYDGFPGKKLLKACEAK